MSDIQEMQNNPLLSLEMLKTIQNRGLILPVSFNNKTANKQLPKERCQTSN